MARRRSRGNNAGLVFLVVIGAIVWAVSTVWNAWSELVGPANAGPALIGCVVALAATVGIMRSYSVGRIARQNAQANDRAIAVQALLTTERRAGLLAVYRNEDVVEMILAGQIWQGMTENQLFDAWGRPDAVDQKVMKTRIRHTFKYGQTGRNRYARRVFVENGIVVGWEILVKPRGASSAP